MQRRTLIREPQRKRVGNRMLVACINCKDRKLRVSRTWTLRVHLVRSYGTKLTGKASVMIKSQLVQTASDSI